MTTEARNPVNRRCVTGACTHCNTVTVAVALFPSEPNHEQQSTSDPALELLTYVRYVFDY